MPVCANCGTHYGPTVRICIRDGTPLTTGRAADPHLGTILDGKYRIDGFISAGGMGSVYRAVHVMLDKTVAVKVIKDELVTSDEIVARFQREARAASNLDHPNIVSVYDLGQTPTGTLYIAMEFIDGPSLKDVIQKNGPLSPAEAVDILRQVASALSAAHRKQIVHRDLKSHNLMLEPDNGRQVVKLVDFGIAKTFDDSTQLTAAGYMLGTPHYMSPEQAAGKPVDHRADLYSLGVILYEMMTGEVPFGDAALTSVLVRLATEVPPPPSARRPDLRVPPALDAVALRCLEKDPDRRFQSADEFAEALERAHRESLSQPTLQRPVVPAVQETLVRPDPRRVASIPTGESGGVPAARPSAGLGVNRRTWAIALGLGVAAIGIAIAIGLSNRGTDTVDRAAITPASPSASATPAPAPSATAPSATAQRPVTSGPDVSASPTVEQPASPPPINPDRSGTPTVRPSSGQAPPVAPPVAATPPPPSPQPRPTGADTTPAAEPVTVAVPAPSPAPIPAPTSALTLPSQGGRNAPSVTVACKGMLSVCTAIRTELVRVLQADGFPVVNTLTPAEIHVMVNVALVSETPGMQAGTPIVMRTFSVDLTGNSGTRALVMPEPRIFSFDDLFSRGVLQNNASQIATGAAEGIRAFAGR